MSLSVIIPNYNQAKYLKETLEAILAQSLQEIDILVVDDASTDESCKIVEEYQKKDSRLSLLRLEKNSGGPIVPIREGLKHVRGDYIALIAGDDIVQPHFFEEAIDVVKKYPEVGICFGNYLLFADRRPYFFKEISILDHPEPMVLKPEEMVALSRTKCFHIPSQSSIYRKDLLLKFGGYREELKGYSDFYLNFQIASRYPIAFVPKIWSAFRLVPRSFGRSLRFMERWDLCAKLLKAIESEEKEIQLKWFESGILAYGGIVFIAYLAQHVKYWKYLPLLLKKFIAIKFRVRVAPLIKKFSARLLP